MYGYVNVKVTQSCPYLCDPMHYTVHGILQARILEWVAVPFSSRYSQLKDQTHVSCIVGGFFTTELPGKPISQSSEVITDNPTVNPGDSSGQQSPHDHLEQHLHINHRQLQSPHQKKELEIQTIAINCFHSHKKESYLNLQSNTALFISRRQRCTIPLWGQKEKKTGNC